LRFNERSHFYNIKVQGEAVSSDVEAAASYPDVADLDIIVDEGDHTTQEIFNVHKTSFFWKKMPSRIFIDREEKSRPGFKGQADALIRS
jgi:hypothetical protein